MTPDGEPAEPAADRPRSAADALRRGAARTSGAEAVPPAAAEPPAAATPGPAATSDSPEPTAAAAPAAAAYDDVATPPVGPETAATEPTATASTATETATETEPIETTPASPGAGAPRQPRRVAIPLLAAAAVLLGLGVTLATLHVSNARAVAQARTDALAESKKAVTAILSASYRTVDADIAAARKHLTPRFQQDYDKIAQGSYRQLVVDNQSITTAEVQSAGVKQASRNRVVVLLFVNELSTNNKRAVPRLDQPRVRMTLVLRDGKWLVDRMNAI